MAEQYASDLRPMRYWTQLADAKMEMWEKGLIEGYSTGFPTLDRNFRLVNSEFFVIAGASSMGKTALGMQMCESVAKQLMASNDPGVVAIFSAEMTGWSLSARMAGLDSNINTHLARMGKLSPEQYRLLRKQNKANEDLPIWIDETAAPTTASMLAKLKSLSDMIPIRMMMFDFVELGGNRAQSEEMRISDIAQALKDIAKNMEIPVVALSQVNAKHETNPTKVPALSDFRYSAAVGHLSDTALFIVRPEYYFDRGQECKVECETDKRGVAYISIAKNRQGPVTMVKLAFIKQYMKFGELERIDL